MNETLHIVGLVILLILGAFFSSSELAFVVANKIKIEIWARKEKLSAKYSRYFLNNPNYFFSTILIGQNVVNIAFASISAVVFAELFHLNEFWILIVSSLMILIFAELIPKYLARDYPDRILEITIVPIRWLNVLFFPFVKISSLFSNLLTESENVREESYATLIGKEDIKELLNESSEAGNVGEEAKDILEKVFELGERKVYEVMTPRTEIVGVDIESSIKEVINTFIESGYSKLPVYEENLDNIKGVVFAYDMFKRPTELKSVIRETIFIPETKKALEMLREFLEKRISIAIVVDEFGGTAGIVTLEDVIEEMFGEIRDEYDVEDEICKEVEKNVYVISGKFEIDKLNEEYNLGLPEGDYETIGGFITAHIGRIPKKGETLEIKGFRINVLHSDKTKINLIKLFKE
jgi:CBS domain containing-hemolysin-like protein